jgi:hypothetical protein
VDLEAVETAVRVAVLAAGTKVIEELLRNVGVGRRESEVRCPRCAVAMKSKGPRPLAVLTLLGWVRFKRSMYVCPCCNAKRYLGDEELDIVNTSRSPGVRRQVTRLGAKETFAEVSEDLQELAGLALCRKEAERIAETEGQRMEDWMAQERQALRVLQPPVDTEKSIDTLYIELDGTGIPMVPSEVEGRKGKQPDGTAKTREAKVGCVFTQTKFDDEGKPIRDPHSTTFVSAIETSACFGWRLYAESVRRGLFKAKRVIALGDGAEWVKNTAQTHFGTAQFIIDFYHASEHIGDLCRALFDRDVRQTDYYHEKWTDSLWEGEIEAIIQSATNLLPKDPRTKNDARILIAYFEKNKEHMRYAHYRQQGLFIGSGVVEATCKHLVGHRLKQSGMEWTVRGANAILAARAVRLSNRTEEYWEQRNAA